MKVAAQSLVPIVVAIVTAIAFAGNDPATTRRNAERCATVAIATIQWSCPGSVDGEPLFESITAPAPRGIGR